MSNRTVMVTLRWIPTDHWGINELLDNTPRKAWEDEVCSLVKEDLSAFLDECQLEVEIKEGKRK